MASIDARKKNREIEAAARKQAILDLQNEE